MARRGHVHGAFGRRPQPRTDNGVRCEFRTRGFACGCVKCEARLSQRQASMAAQRALNETPELRSINRTMRTARA